DMPRTTGRKKVFRVRFKVKDDFSNIGSVIGVEAGSDELVRKTGSCEDWLFKDFKGNFTAVLDVYAGLWIFCLKEIQPLIYCKTADTGMIFQEYLDILPEPFIFKTSSTDR